MVALKDVERLMGKRIPKERLEGYAPQEIQQQKGARKNPNEFKKTDGAFGKKKNKTASAPKNKKRKTTKRDGFKKFDDPKPKSEKKNNKRGRGRK